MCLERLNSPGKNLWFLRAKFAYLESTPWDYGDPSIASNAWSDKFMIVTEFRGTWE